MKDFQLEMNFAAYRNRFRDALDRGDFVLLFEHSAPGRDNDPAAAADRLKKLESAVLEIPFLQCALAITDGCGGSETFRALDYAANLSEESRDRHVVYLTGRSTPMAEAQALLAQARSAGLYNIVPVTGDAVPGENVRQTRKRIFTESVHMLKMLSNDREFPAFPGCVMNPAQYTPYSLFPQYFMLVKKLNAGARFIVTQANWDMLKLQALRWYLGERGLFFPTIARLMLLTPELVEKILSGKMPGVRISPDFREMLEKELRFSLNQFEAAQWRRLELQVSGCRLLGYSGVQLYGVDSPQKVRAAADRVAGALREFTSFDQWLEEYNSYLARTEMAPFGDSFYMYDRILRRAYPETLPRISDIGPLKVSAAEKTAYELRKFFFAHADGQDASNRKALKVLLNGCRSCRNCRLPQTFFICPEQCPKRSSNGPCGGVRSDGRCEVGNFECIHGRMMRLAQWRKCIGKMEDEFLPPSSGGELKS